MSLRILSVCLTLVPVTVAGQALHAPVAQKNPLAGNAAAAQAGKKAYVNYCQVCHGGDGKGGRGPALTTGKFEHGGEDWQLFQTIQRGIPGTQMPNFEIPEEEIWQMVTYLQSLSGTTGEEVVAGDVSAGQKVFEEKGGCLLCHQVNGRGGRVGPDLSVIGKWTVRSIRDFILAPSQSEQRQPNVVVVRTQDGKEIRGIRKNEDTYTLQLMDVFDEIHLLEKPSLQEVRYEDNSLMPDHYGQQFSSKELQDLVAYLKSLKVRDLAKVAAAPLDGGLAYERILHSAREPQNWLTYWGDYRGHHYSTLKQINAGNVSKLQTAWAFQFPGLGSMQATPLVIDGLMYTTGPSGYVFALDARSGRQIWQYQHRVKSSAAIPNINVNRGVAVLGPRVFFVTQDAYVVALDAKTGRLLWETEMASMAQGYGASVAPLALKDKVIVGISGAEFGIRGFIDAYDPASGKRIWRFYTVPGPGEFGHETWEGDSWRTGGGSTWMTGTYDADSDTLFWGVGNPSPDLNGDVRMGDNLYTCGLLALDPSTGKRKWHFQFTPHDTHDWDSNETPVLVDRDFKGIRRKLLLHADRNAFFYVLDRETGRFLNGFPFARQTWAKGLDENGRPILVPNSESSKEGQLHYPGLAGATNWQAPTYDPETQLLYIAFREAGDIYYKEEQEYEPGKAFWGGKVVPAKETTWGGVKAINPESGTIEWEYRLHTGSLGAGLLGTAGGIIFVAGADGYLSALETRTGRLLWKFQAGSSIDTSAMSYAVDGRQYIAISAGRVLYSFALPQDTPASGASAKH
ncbi:MAG: PQQ-dependent dehydrogenase, methanol/ethanol family [Acidobacteriota bacterium]